MPGCGPRLRGVRGRGAGKEIAPPQEGRWVSRSAYLNQRTRDSLGTTIDVTAYGRGLYLTRNSAFLRAEGQTAEEVTAALCGQFGIPVGALAATGVPVTRNFLGVTLYKIIMTMYTLAADQTGKKYRIRFRGPRRRLR